MFKGKVAVIIGGSGDIGREICRELSKEGLCIAIHYNKGYELALNLKDEIRNNNRYAEIFYADIRNKKQVDDMMEDIYKKYGQIDYLVNNAGISQIKPFMDITESDWDAMIDTNLKGLFHCTQSALKYMIRQKYGSIVNISSIWGISGASCEVHYSTTKGGIISFTKALAKELGPSNIRINTVAPGVINTKMNNILSNEDKNELIYKTSLGRIGEPLDVAKTVLFLLSDNSSFVTGQTLTVDGGFL